MADEIRFMSICGMLGYGYAVENLKKAIDEYKVDYFACDAGSTDPGPYYLGSGKSFVKPAQIKRDLEPALIAAVKNKKPLIIGSAGGSGAKPHVELFLEILKEISTRNDLHFKLAVIYSDVEKETVLNALQQGRISPCGPVGPLSKEALENSVNIVAQVSTERIIKALKAGADVVISGRCCDTAIFAAPAIMQGFDPGLSLHCAKIAECGCLCARPAGANASLFATIEKDSFTVIPANETRKCFPDSVAAHSLYEQPNPNCFYEPEGKIDMDQSVFEQITERAVKVSGTKLVAPEKPTIKLEAARLVGYRSVTIAGTCDPLVIENLDEIEKQVRKSTEANLKGIIDADKFSLRFMRYGLDAVTGIKLSDKLPSEVGVVIEAIAPTQKLADTVISMARSTALHQSFDGRKSTAGNFAFPFSPSDLSAGAVYEFSIYHLMETKQDECLFQLKMEEI